MHDVSWEQGRAWGHGGQWQHGENGEAVTGLTDECVPCISNGDSTAVSGQHMMWHQHLQTDSLK